MSTKCISAFVACMVSTAPGVVAAFAADAGLESEVLALAAGDLRPWHKGRIDDVPLDLRFLARDDTRVTVVVRRDLDEELRLEGTLAGPELRLDGPERWRLVLDGSRLAGSAERPGVGPLEVAIDLADVRARVIAAHGLRACTVADAGCVLQAAHGVASAIDDPLLRADALGALATAGERMRVAEAADWHEQALDAAATIDDAWMRATTLAGLLAPGKPATTRDRIVEDAVAAARAVPYPGSRAQALALIAERATAIGLADEAADLADEARESARVADSPAARAQALTAVAVAETRLERPAAAFATIAEVLDAATAMPRPDQQVRVLARLQDMDDDDDVWPASVGVRPVAADLPRAEVLLLAAERLLHEDPDEARQLLERALAAAPAIREPGARVEVWSRIAVGLARCGESEAARRAALDIETAGHLAWALTEIALVAGADAR